MLPKKLPPFFKYFGSKYRIGAKYPQPEYDVIIEPFAGAAGYSLNHYQKNVILYDLDPIICGVWDYLIKAEPKDILRLPTAFDDIRNLTGICQEERWLMGFWVNNSSRPCNVPGAWMKDGTCPGSFWGERKKESIVSHLQYIKHWKIKNCSYENIPNEDPACWFIDPPYQEAGKHYTCGSSGIDFVQLGKWCMERNGQYIVCEAEGADWLEFKPFLIAQATPGKYRKKISKEVIFTNSNIQQNLEEFLK